jgi:Tol biopolymer transport system component/DNA-binding winged helix-turn-helix (wHTH) protein
MSPETSSSRTAAFGAYSVDFRSGELRKHGIRIKLGEQPLQILMLLLERDGGLVTREELRAELWSSDTFVDFDHGLNSAVQRLRDCLSDSAGKAKWVETVPRRGYRFAGKIEWTQIGSSGKIIDATVPATGEGRPAEIEAPVSTTPETDLVPGRKFLWRTAAGIAALAVMLVVLLRPPTASPHITQTLQLTSDGLEKIGFMATDGIRVYFSEKVNGHWTVAAVPVSGGTVDPLPIPFRDATLVNISPDRSELLITEGPLDDHPLWVVSVLGGTPRRLGNMLAHSASWSPDGRRLVYATGGELFIAQADGSGPRSLAPAEPDQDMWAWSPAWSADGKRVRFELYDMKAHASVIWETTVNGQNLHRVFSPPDSAPMQCCGVWTPNQQYFVFDAWKEIEAGSPTAPASEIWAVREASRFLPKPQPLPLTIGPVHFFVHVISADGSTIFALSTQRRGELVRYDAASQQLSPFLAGISADNISFSRDGEWVAYVKYPQGELWRSRADGSDPLQLTFRPLMTLGPHWSPDGKQIAFTGHSAGTRFQPYLVSSDGSTMPRAIAAAGADPTWSPDNGSLLFVNLESIDNSFMQILNFRNGTLSQVPGSNGIGSPRWSPDGRYISAIEYASHLDNRLMLFDFQTGKWTRQAQIVATFQNWSRDGKYIYFLSGDSEPRIFRLTVADNRLTKVLDLKNFRAADPDGGWFSLGPHDEPLVLRETGGGTEVYALKWEAK